MSLSYFWSFNIHILGHHAFERQIFKYERFTQSRQNWVYEGKNESQVQEKWSLVKQLSLGEENRLFLHAL